MSEIYALTDDFYTPNLESSVKEILDCGIKIVQFRSKKDSVDINLVKKLVEICSKYSANLIVNDSIELAKKVDAHGVHIGKGDGEVSVARETLGKDKIIGVSCYGDINLALSAESLGANYAAFGAAFRSSTKREAQVFELGKFGDFKKCLSIKTCLIGGINASNLEQILELKPDYIALVSALYKGGSITKNIKNLQSIMERKWGQ